MRPNYDAVFLSLEMGGDTDKAETIDSCMHGWPRIVLIISERAGCSQNLNTTLIDTMTHSNLSILR